MKVRHLIAAVALGASLSFGLGVLAQAGYPTIVRFLRVNIGTGTTTNLANGDLRVNGGMAIATGTTGAISGRMLIATANAGLIVDETDGGSNSFVGFYDAGTPRAYVGSQNVTGGALCGTGAAEGDLCLRTEAGALVVSTNAGTSSIDLTPQNGTLTASFDNCCATTPTMVFDWQRIGNFVTFAGRTYSGAATGDSTSYVTTGAPVPAALRPATQVISAPFAIANDNGAAAWACLVIGADGNIAFHKATSSTLCAAAGWTASGTRTIAQPEIGFSYMLGNP